jgi:hypothetical protein
MFLSTVVRDKKNKPIGCMVNVLRGNIMDNIVNEIEIDKGYYPIIVNTKTNEIITSTEKIPQDKKEEYTNLITSIGKELNEYIDTIRSRCYVLESEMLSLKLHLTVDTFVNAFRNGIKLNTITIEQAFSDTIIRARNCVRYYT